MTRRASLPVPVRPLRPHLFVQLRHHELQVHQQEVLLQGAGLQHHRVEPRPRR
jgi:hypothetical protein